MQTSDEILSVRTIRTLHIAQAAFVVLIPTVLVCFLTYHTTRFLKTRKQSLISTEHMQLFGYCPSLPSIFFLFSDDQRKDKSAQVLYYLPAVTICFAFTHVSLYLYFLPDHHYLFKSASQRRRMGRPCQRLDEGVNENDEVM